MQDFKEKLNKYRYYILFLLIFGVLVFALNMAIDQWCIRDDNVVTERNKSAVQLEREPEETIDAVLLGDSMSYSAICAPQIWHDYGYTVFLGGQAGQTIQEAYQMLRNVYRTQSPSLVVIDCGTLFRAEDLTYTPENSIMAWLNARFPIIRDHAVWKSLFFNKEYPIENHKGFALRVAYSPYTDGDYMTETEERADMPLIVVRYLKKIQRLCKKNGSELFLVSTPSPMNCSYEQYNTLCDYAEEYGLKYLDMNFLCDEIGINWEEDTLDKGDHLNLIGSLKATSYFGRYLKENFDLPDHRGDSAYSSWDQAYEAYAPDAVNNIRWLYETIGNVTEDQIKSVQALVDYDGEV